MPSTCGDGVLCASTLPQRYAVDATSAQARTGYEHYPEDVRAALTPALVAHRDLVYRDYLTLPIDA